MADIVRSTEVLQNSSLKSRTETNMSLSFNVKNAGPLTQVDLAASGGRSVPTSSFNLVAYRDIRESHRAVQGIVAQDGNVKNTPLPKASTAIPQHPGTACLRVLTTELLCYYVLRSFD